MQIRMVLFYVSCMDEYRMTFSDNSDGRNGSEDI